MATSGDITVKPDHVIIWLDKNMGVKENNQFSKAVLDTNANLDRPPADEASININRLICKLDPVLNKKKYDDLIKSPLRMFIDENECIKCINDSIAAKKKTYVIASGEKGALIVPEIHKKLSGYIYIFCGQRALHDSWTKPYQNDIEIYDDEKGVFGKVLSDIGIYYLQKGQEEESNQAAAIQHFYWAQRLFTSAGRLDRNKREDFLRYVRDGLTKLNASISDGYDSDTQIAQDANDV